MDSFGGDHVVLRVDIQWMIEIVESILKRIIGLARNPDGNEEMNNLNSEVRIRHGNR